MLEFTSEAELKAHYAALIARRKALKPPTPKEVPKPPPQVFVTTHLRRPWQTPTVQQVELAKAEHGGITIDRIIRLVAYRFNVDKTDLISSRRTANIMQPRQIAMYLCKVLTLKSMPEIGRRMGGRDHTTILHGYRKIEARRQFDADLDATINELKTELGAA